MVSSNGVDPIRGGTKRARKPERERSPSPTPTPSLETDDEVDEFAEDYQSDDNDGTDAEGSDDDVQGVTRYEPDELDGLEDEVETDDESASDDPGRGGGDERSERSAQLQKLQRGLKDVPLATLLRAQHAVPDDESDASSSDSEDGSAPESSSAPSAREQKLAQIKARLRDMQRAKGKALHVEEERVAPEERERREEAERIRIKREAKHAPMAMSTKKQVSRKRQVIELPKIDRRDPRFLSVSAGQVNPHLHSQSYAFLPGMLKAELNEKKAALYAARKLEANAPVAQRAMRISEREAIERDLARVRSKLERTERETRERETLAKIKKEERTKREAGKGEWYMKRSEQKEALLKARFDSLQARGGKSAVKKAIEKKQKKVAGKEKKSRPFAPGQAEAVGSGPNKRRKV